MSLFCKFILVLVAVFALLQLSVEMARIPRDEAAAAAAGTDNNIDLKATMDSLMEKFRGLIDEEKLKEIIHAASDALAEGAKKLKEQI